MTDDPWFDQFNQGGIPGIGGGMGPSSPALGGSGAPPPTGGQSGVSGNAEAFRAAWYASPYPKNVTGLKQFVDAHPEFGATVTGSKGSKIIIGGQAFQAVRSAGDNGGLGPAWDPLGPEGGGGAGAHGQPFGYMTTPMSEFSQPTAEDALNSPGLQFALSEANRMGQNSAAAKGTLLNGRFQQALYASNIQNALQGYGDVYNRAANTFGINYGVKTGNQDRPFDKYSKLAGLGQKSVGES